MITEGMVTSTIPAGTPRPGATWCSASAATTWEAARNPNSSANSATKKKMTP